jgi:hypothetical protein
MLNPSYGSWTLDHVIESDHWRAEEGKMVRHLADGSENNNASVDAAALLAEVDELRRRLAALEARFPRSGVAEPPERRQAIRQPRPRSKTNAAELEPDAAARLARRRALGLGALASLFAFIGRSAARATDALTIEPDGATIAAKKISFGNRYGDLLVFWEPAYTAGIQDATLYHRSAESFAWYQGGKYSVNTKLDPGGGSTVMSLSKGNLAVSGTVTAGGEFVGKGTATLQKGLTVTGDASLQSVTVGGSINFGQRLAALLTLWNPDYVIGIQPSTFYQRSAQHFAWYKGGQHTGTELDSGGGSKMMSLTDGNLTVAGNVQLGAPAVSAAGGVESLRIIRGIVNSNGTKYAGGGFSVQRSDNGLYDIVFGEPASPFPSVPGATATQIFGALNPGNMAATATGSTKPGDTAVIVHLSADRMRVGTWTPSGREDRVFSFIVIGPR